ncbi:hypothetical protein B7486_07865 [cyanobacterium TDX16]|nr:hypothetical protein B7486_07865 [cyanobacterium TDX16]
MSPSQFERVDRLYGQAAELPASQRIAWLSAACNDDDVVRRKVEGMLLADMKAPRQLETPALGASFNVSDAEVVERSLRDEFAASGRFNILSFLGEGGFGSVYRAEQLSPVHRQVALKVIKPGMDSRRVLARFEQERQTLAMMNHPGIAKVFDAGLTPSGRPYFAMELIDGKSINRHCDAMRLDIRGRLELFVQVCSAVRHAHQKGVIHRDLKPSNVLIADRDGSPRPVIIDFGIARAVTSEPGEATRVTELGHMMGTPEYMSPEQARGDPDIDTRADIFALGAMLYYILTGSTTLDKDRTDRSGPLELCRLICHEDPPTPSTRVKSLTAADEAILARCADPVQLSRVLRGDLDVIVMKALEKDRARRYETVDALAEDIERYLRNDTVLARPPTASYRFTKFARRNRGALAAGLGMIFLLVAGVIGTSVGLARARREATIARNESAVSRAVTQFLNGDLLSAVAPDQLGYDARMRDVVDAAAQRVEGRFADQPLVEAAVRLSLGTTYSKLANFPAAQLHLERCHALRRAALGDDAIETLEAENELAEIYLLQDRNTDGERLYVHAYEGRKAQLGEDHIDTITSLYKLGVAIAEQGRYAEAESLMLKTLDRCRAVLGNKHPLTLKAVHSMGVLYRAMNDAERSARYYEEAYRLTRDALGMAHDTTLLAVRDYAAVLQSSHRLSEAETILHEAIPISRRVRGDNHPATLMMLDQLASVLIHLDRADDAEPILYPALEAARQTLPEGHTVTSMLLISMSRLYVAQDRFADAESLLLESIHSRAKTLGADHPWTADAIHELIELYEKTAQPDKAAEWKTRIADVGRAPTH